MTINVAGFPKKIFFGLFIIFSPTLFVWLAAFQIVLIYCVPCSYPNYRNVLMLPCKMLGFLLYKRIEEMLRDGTQQTVGASRVYRKSHSLALFLPLSFSLSFFLSALILAVQSSSSVKAKTHRAHTCLKLGSDVTSLCCWSHRLIIDSSTL